MDDGNSARDHYLTSSSDTIANTENVVMVSAVAQIVSAYVARNEIAQADLPALIASVHRSLVNRIAEPAPKTQRPQQPAVPAKKSVKLDYIVCLEDGKKFKSLKRHLRAVYKMTPEQYREKWNLPSDYPMVAPGYAKRRSELAKNMGLGSRNKDRVPSKSQP
jgi:predicted transcriptional regulator